MTVDLFERTLDDRVEQFGAAEAEGLLPFFRPVESAVGPTVRVDGRECVMLGSNNYLGLTSDPRVIAGAEDALRTYGSGLTGSRLLNGTIPLHRELEDEIAAWLGTEAALVFTTGYLANVGCLSALLQPGDTVVCDSGDHASLLDGVALSGARLRAFRHGRLDKLEASLERAQRAGEGGILVVVDGVFSMEGDIADLPAIAELCDAYGARLMVDEAHSCGVLGPTGAGVSELQGIQPDLRMGTFSKSLASCGGFIAGPASVIRYLRISARSFLFTAAAVPAAVGAALAAVRICRSPEGPDLFGRVLANARYLREELRELGFRVEPVPSDGVVSPIVPVAIGDDWSAGIAWKTLFDDGVFTNAALYPAVPKGAALLRTSVMATHERSDLDRALERFEELGRRQPELLHRSGNGRSTMTTQVTQEASA